MKSCYRGHGLRFTLSLCWFLWLPRSRPSAAGRWRAKFRGGGGAAEAGEVAAVEDRRAFPAVVGHRMVEELPVAGRGAQSPAEGAVPPEASLFRAVGLLVVAVGGAARRRRRRAASPQLNKHGRRVLAIKQPASPQPNQPPPAPPPAVPASTQTPASPQQQSQSSRQSAQSTNRRDWQGCWQPAARPTKLPQINTMAGQLYGDVQLLLCGAAAGAGQGSSSALPSLPGKQAQAKVLRVYDVASGGQWGHYYQCGATWYQPTYQSGQMTYGSGLPQ
jgi:hypothetical protein